MYSCKIIYCIAFILFYFKVFIVVCLGCTAIGKTYLFHIRTELFLIFSRFMPQYAQDTFKISFGFNKSMLKTDNKVQNSLQSNKLGTSD